MNELDYLNFQKETRIVSAETSLFMKNKTLYDPFSRKYPKIRLCKALQFEKQI